MDVEQERLRLASEAAALRLMRALAARELKYREGQAREPATGRGGRGGRFADEGRGAGSGSTSGGGARGFAPPVAAAAGRTAARAAPTVVSAGALEAAPALAPGAGAAIAAGVGVSRAAGLAAVGSGAAGGMTPILGLPLPHLLPRAFKTPIGGGPPEPVPRGQFDDECEEQLERDLVTCQTRAAMYARGRRSRRQIYAICERTAVSRYSECLTGGISATRTEIYNAHQHFSPRRR